MFVTIRGDSGHDKKIAHVCRMEHLHIVVVVRKVRDIRPSPAHAAPHNGGRQSLSERHVSR